MTGKMKALAGDCAKGACLLWLIVHFSLTILYCFPLNPLKMQLEPVLSATIGAYFSQNWSLFAPNPVQANQQLLVKCLDEAAAKAVEEDGLQADDWFDLTGPLIANHQQHRFSAYDRLSRPQTNFIRQFVAGGAHLAPLAKQCRDGKKVACELYSTRLSAARAAAAVPLARIASSFCRESGSGRVTKVALRLRERPIVPWSERGSSMRPQSKDFELGVFDLDRNVPLVGIFAGGAKS